MHMTKNKLKSLIKDEKQASKTYKRYGFKTLSKDEYSHYNFLKKKLK